MKLSIDTRIKLNDDNKIPLFGLGVYQSPTGQPTIETVRHALNCGYRHIDTAAIYGNEKDVGRALRESGVKREDVFLTTKLWNADQGYESTLKAYDESLRHLGVEYVDLYLIHWPLEKKRSDSWRALVELKKTKRCRSVGVSNYTIRHLEELMGESDLVPSINQVEFSPFLYQKELLDFCQKSKIRLEAYSPLTRGEKLKDKTLMTIAAKYKKSTAQILIRWCLQMEVIVIPKSNHPQRIEENADVFDFEISPGDMRILANLNENLRTSWDPTDVP